MTQQPLLLTLEYNYRLISILNETSKPPLDIFSSYIKGTRLNITLNTDISILDISKFYNHKLTLTCSIDRLYKGTITFIFRQTLEFEHIA